MHGRQHKDYNDSKTKMHPNINKFRVNISDQKIRTEIYQQERMLRWQSSSREVVELLAWRRRPRSVLG